MHKTPEFSAKPSEGACGIRGEIKQGFFSNKMIAESLDNISPTLSFWIPGSCVPKARARVTRNGTYFPKRYQEWRRLAETEILIALKPSEKALLPIQRAEVRILLQGKHRGDIDNISGSCLDALTSAQVLLDDRLSCLPRLVIEHDPKGECGVLIEIKLLK